MTAKSKAFFYGCNNRHEVHVDADEEEDICRHDSHEGVDVGEPCPSPPCHAWAGAFRSPVR